jgi:hypothetical protein
VYILIDRHAIEFVSLLDNDCNIHCYYSIIDHFNPNVYLKKPHRYSILLLRNWIWKGNMLNRIWKWSTDGGSLRMGWQKRKRKEMCVVVI